MDFVVPELQSAKNVDVKSTSILSLDHPGHLVRAITTTKRRARAFHGSRDVTVWRIGLRLRQPATRRTLQNRFLLQKDWKFLSGTGSEDLRLGDKVCSRLRSSSFPVLPEALFRSGPSAHSSIHIDMELPSARTNSCSKLKRTIQSSCTGLYYF